MQLGLPLPSGLTNGLLYETYPPATEQANANATYLVQSRAFAPCVQREPIDVHPLVNWDEFGVSNV